MFKKQKQKPVEQSVVEGMKAGKEKNKREVRITVFPEGGGRPWLVDVEPDEHGHFQLTKDHPGEYKVQPGSLWEEDGRLRGLVHEGNAQTVNSWTLSGDDTFDPIALHGVASNNYWEQLAEIARRKSPWKQASTWLFATLSIVLILVMVWQVKTTGDGLEQLRDAVANMQVGGGGETGSGGGTAQAGGGDGTGHQPIAPDGGG